MQSISPPLVDDSARQHFEVNVDPFGSRDKAESPASWILWLHFWTAPACSVHQLDLAINAGNRKCTLQAEE